MDHTGWLLVLLVLLLAVPVWISQWVGVRRKQREMASLPLDEQHVWGPARDRGLGFRCQRCGAYGNFPTHMSWPARCPDMLAGNQSGE